MPIISGSVGGGLGAVALSGTPAAGQAPVASSAAAATWKYPPGFEFGYDQITAGVNITGTTAATANTIITCAAHTFDGAAVMCDFFSPQVAFPTGGLNNTLGIALWEGASELGEFAFMRTDQTTNQDFKAVLASVQFTPTAGSHTYLLKAYVSSTTGTPSIGAGAGGVGVIYPAFVHFTKV